MVNYRFETHFHVLVMSPQYHVPFDLNFHCSLHRLQILLVDSNKIDPLHPHLSNHFQLLLEMHMEWSHLLHFLLR